MSINWFKVDPSKLEPNFRKDVEELLGKSLYSWYITFGFRSLAEQAKLYEIYQNGGPRAAPAGKSAHNFGLAVDVVVDIDKKAGLQASWDERQEAWKWLYQVVAIHPRLKSGKTFGDGGHIERYKWSNFKNW